MTPRRSALLAGLLALLAVVAGVIATTQTRGTASVQSLLGAQGAQGAAAVRPAPGYGPVPPLSPATAWDNTQPLTGASLRGKVVLVDFWTASCINCRRTFGFLRKLQDTYASRGLVVLGVHSPEFDFEKSHAYVARSVSELHVTWPVAEDPDMSIWNEFHNSYWPANYLVDRAGNVRYYHVGEGDDEQVEGAVRALLDEGGSAGGAVVGRLRQSEQPPTAGEPVTPETYLGTTRSQSSSAVGYGPGVRRGPDAATLPAGGSLTLRYEARDVYLVLSAPMPGTVVDVTLDGTPVPAARRGPALSVTAAGRTVARAGASDLAHLITGPAIAPGRLALTATGHPVLAYSFTFGA